MGGPGGHVPPQVLGYQLTLFEPRGQIMPAILLPCPPIFLVDAAFLYIYIYIRISLRAQTDSRLFVGTSDEPLANFGNGIVSALANSGNGVTSPLQST